MVHCGDYEHETFEAHCILRGNGSSWINDCAFGQFSGLDVLKYCSQFSMSRLGNSTNSAYGYVLRFNGSFCPFWFENGMFMPHYQTFYVHYKIQLHEGWHMSASEGQEEFEEAQAEVGVYLVLISILHYRNTLHAMIVLEIGVCITLLRYRNVKWEPMRVNIRTWNVVAVGSRIQGFPVYLFCLK